MGCKINKLDLKMPMAFYMEDFRLNKDKTKEEFYKGLLPAIAEFMDEGKFNLTMEAIKAQAETSNGDINNEPVKIDLTNKILGTITSLTAEYDMVAVLEEDSRETSEVVPLTLPTYLYGIRSRKDLVSVVDEFISEATVDDGEVKGSTTQGTKDTGTDKDEEVIDPKAHLKGIKEGLNVEETSDDEILDLDDIELDSQSNASIDFEEEIKRASEELEADGDSLEGLTKLSKLATTVFEKRPDFINTTIDFFKREAYNRILNLETDNEGDVADGLSENPAYVVDDLKAFFEMLAGTQDANGEEFKADLAEAAIDPKGMHAMKIIGTVVSQHFDLFKDDYMTIVEVDENTNESTYTHGNKSVHTGYTTEANKSTESQMPLTVRRHFDNIPRLVKDATGEYVQDDAKPFITYNEVVNTFSLMGQLGALPSSAMSKAEALEAIVTGNKALKDVGPEQRRVIESIFLRFYKDGVYSYKNTDGEIKYLRSFRHHAKDKGYKSNHPFELMISSIQTEFNSNTNKKFMTIDNGTLVMTSSSLNDTRSVITSAFNTAITRDTNSSEIRPTISQNMSLSSMSYKEIKIGGNKILKQKDIKDINLSTIEDSALNEELIRKGYAKEGQKIEVEDKKGIKISFTKTGGMIELYADDFKQGSRGGTVVDINANEDAFKKRYTIPRDAQGIQSALKTLNLQRWMSKEDVDIYMQNQDAHTGFNAQIENLIANFALMIGANTKNGAKALKAAGITLKTDVPDAKDASKLQYPIENYIGGMFGAISANYDIRNGLDVSQAFKNINGESQSVATPSRRFDDLPKFVEETQDHLDTLSENERETYYLNSNIYVTGEAKLKGFYTKNGIKKLQRSKSTTNFSMYEHFKFLVEGAFLQGAAQTKFSSLFLQPGVYSDKSSKDICEIDITKDGTLDGIDVMFPRIDIGRGTYILDERKLKAKHYEVYTNENKAVEKSILLSWSEHFGNEWDTNIDTLDKLVKFLEENPVSMREATESVHLTANSDYIKGKTATLAPSLVELVRESHKPMEESLIGEYFEHEKRSFLAQVNASGYDKGKLNPKSQTILKGIFGGEVSKETLFTAFFYNQNSFGNSLFNLTMGSDFLFPRAWKESEASISNDVRIDESLDVRYVKENATEEEYQLFRENKAKFLYWNTDTNAMMVNKIKRAASVTSTMKKLRIAKSVDGVVMPTVKVVNDGVEAKRAAVENQYKAQNMEIAKTNNNNFEMEFTADGSDSMLYDKILKTSNGMAVQADHTKALIYTDKFKEFYGDWQSSEFTGQLNIQGEPIMTEKGEFKALDGSGYFNIHSEQIMGAFNEKLEEEVRRKANEGLEEGALLGQYSNVALVQDPEWVRTLLGGFTDEDGDPYDAAQIAHPLYHIMVSNSLGGPQSGYDSEGAPAKDLTFETLCRKMGVRFQKKATFAMFFNEMLRNMASPSMLRLFHKMNTQVKYPNVSILVPKVDMDYNIVKDEQGREVEELKKFDNLQELWEYFGDIDNDNSWNQVSEVLGKNPIIRESYVQKVGFISGEKIGNTGINGPDLMKGKGDIIFTPMSNRSHGIILNALHNYDTTHGHGLHGPAQLSNPTQLISSLHFTGDSRTYAEAVNGAFAGMGAVNMVKARYQMVQQALDAIKMARKETEKKLFDSGQDLDEAVIDKLTKERLGLSNYEELLNVKLEYNNVDEVYSMLDGTDLLYEATTQFSRDIVSKAIADREMVGANVDILNDKMSDPGTKLLINTVSSNIAAFMTKEVINVRFPGGQFVVGPSYDLMHMFTLPNGHRVSTRVYQEALLMNDYNTLEYSEVPEVDAGDDDTPFGIKYELNTTANDIYGNLVEISTFEEWSNTRVKEEGDTLIDLNTGKAITKEDLSNEFFALMRSIYLANPELLSYMRKMKEFYLMDGSTQIEEAYLDALNDINEMYGSEKISTLQRARELNNSSFITKTEVDENGIEIESHIKYENFAAELENSKGDFNIMLNGDVTYKAYPQGKKLAINSKEQLDNLFLNTRVQLDGEIMSLTQAKRVLKAEYEAKKYNGEIVTASMDQFLTSKSIYYAPVPSGTKDQYLKAQNFINENTGESAMDTDEYQTLYYLSAKGTKGARHSMTKSAFDMLMAVDEDVIIEGEDGSAEVLTYEKYDEARTFNETNNYILNKVQFEENTAYMNKFEDFFAARIKDITTNPDREEDADNLKLAFEDMKLTFKKMFLEDGWVMEKPEFILPMVHQYAYGLQTGDDIAEIMGYNLINPDENHTEKWFYDKAMSRSSSFDDIFNPIEYFGISLEDSKVAIGTLLSKVAKQVNDAKNPIVKEALTKMYKDIKKVSRDIDNVSNGNTLDGFNIESFVNGLNDTIRHKIQRHKSTTFRHIAKIRAKNFPKTLDMISGRIPGQGKASFTAGKIVGFVNATKNSSYGPFELNLTTGQDHDVDKTNIIVQSVNEYGEIYGYDKYVGEDGEIDPSKFYQVVADKVNEARKIEDPDRRRREIDNVMKVEYNAFVEGSKNFILDNMLTIFSDPKNAIELNALMTMDPLKKVLKELDEVKALKKADPNASFYGELSPINPASTPAYEIENAVGKDAIAIFAAAIKTYSAVFSAYIKADDRHTEYPKTMGEIKFIKSDKGDGKKYRKNLTKEEAKLDAKYTDTLEKTHLNALLEASEATQDSEGNHVDAEIDIDPFSKNLIRKYLDKSKDENIVDGSIAVGEDVLKVSRVPMLLQFEREVPVKKTVVNEDGTTSDVKVLVVKKMVRAVDSIGNSERALSNDQLDILKKNGIIDEEGNVNEGSVTSDIVMDIYNKIDRSFGQDDVSLALSALLSAATDNAKELILKKIGASSDTDGIISTLLMAGFTLPDVLHYINSFGVKNILDKVADGGDAEKYDYITTLKKQISTEERLAGVASKRIELARAVSEGNTEDIKRLSQEYAFSPIVQFAKVQKMAAETLIISKVLGINSKGIGGVPFDLYLYPAKINNSINQIYAEAGFEVSKPLGTELKGSDGKINKDFSGFDIMDFVNNEEIRNAHIDLFNTIKVGFNIPLVIAENKHFFEYVKSVGLVQDTLRKSTYYQQASETLMSKLIEGVYNNNDRYDADAYNLHLGIASDTSKTSIKNFSDDQHRDLTNLLFSTHLIKYFENNATDVSLTLKKGDTRVYDLSRVSDRQRFIDDMPKYIRAQQAVNMAAKSSTDPVENSKYNSFLELLNAKNKVDNVKGGNYQEIESRNLALYKEASISALQGDYARMSESAQKALFCYTLLLDRGGFAGKSFTKCVPFSVFKDYTRFSASYFKKNKQGKIDELLDLPLKTIALYCQTLLPLVSTKPKKGISVTNNSLKKVSNNVNDKVKAKKKKGSNYRAKEYTLFKSRENNKVYVKFEMNDSQGKLNTIALEVTPKYHKLAIPLDYTAEEVVLGEDLGSIAKAGYTLGNRAQFSEDADNPVFGSILRATPNSNFKNYDVLVERTVDGNKVVSLESMNGDLLRKLNPQYKLLKNYIGLKDNVDIANENEKITESEVFDVFEGLAELGEVDPANESALLPLEEQTKLTKRQKAAINKVIEVGLDFKVTEAANDFVFLVMDYLNETMPGAYVQEGNMLKKGQMDTDIVKNVMGNLFTPVVIDGVEHYKISESNFKYLGVPKSLVMNESEVKDANLADKVIPYRHYEEKIGGKLVKSVAVDVETYEGVRESHYVDESYRMKEKSISAKADIYLHKRSVNVRDFLATYYPTVTDQKDVYKIVKYFIRRAKAVYNPTVIDGILTDNNYVYGSDDYGRSPQGILLRFHQMMDTLANLEKSLKDKTFKTELEPIDINNYVVSEKFNIYKKKTVKPLIKHKNAATIKVLNKRGAETGHVWSNFGQLFNVEKIATEEHKFSKEDVEVLKEVMEQFGVDPSSRSARKAIYNAVNSDTLVLQGDIESIRNTKVFANDPVMNATLEFLYRTQETREEMPTIVLTNPLDDTEVYEYIPTGAYAIPKTLDKIRIDGKIAVLSDESYNTSKDTRNAYANSVGEVFNSIMTHENYEWGNWSAEAYERSRSIRKELINKSISKYDDKLAYLDALASAASTETLTPANKRKVSVELQAINVVKNKLIKVNRKAEHEKIVEQAQARVQAGIKRRKGTEEVKPIVPDDGEFSFSLDANHKSKARRAKKEISKFVFDKLEQLLPDIKMNIMTTEELRVEYGDVAARAKGGVINGEVFINSDKFTLDTPFHEIGGHLYFQWLKANDRGTYDSIVKQVLNLPLADTVRNVYEHLTNEEDIAEEVFATYLGFEAQGLVEKAYDGDWHGVQDTMEDGKQSVWKWLKNLINKVFNLNLGEKTEYFPDDNLDTIVKSITSDLLFNNGRLLNQGVTSYKERKVAISDYLTKADLDLALKDKLNLNDIKLSLETQGYIRKVCR